VTQQQIPAGSIIITPADLYAKVTALTDAVTELVATDKAEQRERAALAAQVAALGVRVSAIEKKIWLVTGGAAAIGAGLGSWLPSALGQ